MRINPAQAYSVPGTQQPIKPSDRQPVDHDEKPAHGAVEQPSPNPVSPPFHIPRVANLSGMELQLLLFLGVFLEKALGQIINLNDTTTSTTANPIQGPPISAGSESDGESSGLSGGGIAGVVIGALAVVALFMLALALRGRTRTGSLDPFYFLRQRRGEARLRQPAEGEAQGPPPQQQVDGPRSSADPPAAQPHLERINVQPANPAEQIPLPVRLPPMAARPGGERARQVPLPVRLPPIARHPDVEQDGDAEFEGVAAHLKARRGD